MTDTDTSELRALGEAELHALADIVLADFENSDGSNETVLQMCGRIIAGGFRRDPDLIAKAEAYDQLRGQVARVEALRAEYAKDDNDHLNTFGQHHPVAGIASDHLIQALAIPAEPAGVSREAIEQVRWAEANPDAVALDEVEAARRDAAEGGE